METNNTDYPSNNPNKRTRLSLSEKIYQAIHERIMRGEYNVNEKLPTEKELAAQFGVSRPVLRIALERLRNENLIYSRQGAGNFVRVSKNNSIGYAKVETIADIQRCYEFRLNIETEAASLAALRRNHIILSDMEKALDMLSEATFSRLHREDADFAFHLAITKATNNSYFVETLKALRDHINVGMKLHGEALLSDGAKVLETVFNEHQSIFNAIKDKNPEQARENMRNHIVNSRDRLFGVSLLDLSL